MSGVDLIIISLGGLICSALFPSSFPPIPYFHLKIAVLSVVHKIHNQYL